MAKANSVVDVALLEHCVREDLQNKVKNLEAVITDLRKQITIKDSQIIELTSNNTDLKKENQKLKAEQAAAEEAAAKKGSGKKG